MTREELLKFEIQEQKEVKSFVYKIECEYQDWRYVVERKIADLEKQLAGLEVEVYRGWIPIKGEEYYYITLLGDVESFCNKNDRLDRGIRETNCFGIFKTEEQAKQSYDRHMAGEKLKKLISEENQKQGWKVDWNDGRQYKYFIEWYNHDDNNTVVNATSFLQQVENELYFSGQSSKDQDFLDTIKPLWLKWKGVE